MVTGTLHVAAASPLRHRAALTRRVFFWLLIIGSIGSLVLAPLGPTIDRVRSVGPWVGLGLIMSEVLFVIGLALMAGAMGISLGPNPLRWRSRLDTVLARLDRTPVFWVGLVINTIGALGTGVVLVAAVIGGLPLSAWGLLVLPAADISLTAAVRAAVVRGVRGEHHHLEDGGPHT
ncbi:MAG: hypothetical protein AAF467_06280 [Actinomycetota bacterium]